MTVKYPKSIYAKIKPLKTEAELKEAVKTAKRRKVTKRRPLAGTNIDTITKNVKDFATSNGVKASDVKIRMLYGYVHMEVSLLETDDEVFKRLRADDRRRYNMAREEARRKEYRRQQAAKQAVNNTLSNCCPPSCCCRR